MWQNLLDFASFQTHLETEPLPRLDWVPEGLMGASRLNSMMGILLVLI
jgi:hypothetical protein